MKVVAHWGALTWPIQIDIHKYIPGMHVKNVHFCGGTRLAKSLSVALAVFKGRGVAVWQVWRLCFLVVIALVFFINYGFAIFLAYLASVFLVLTQILVVDSHGQTAPLTSRIVGCFGFQGGRSFFSFSISQKWRRCKKIFLFIYIYMYREIYIHTYICICIYVYHIQ